MPHARNYTGVPERKGENILIPIRELEGDALREDYKPNPPNTRVLIGFGVAIGIAAVIAALF